MELALTVGNQHITPPAILPHGGIGDLQTYLNNVLMIFIIFGVFFFVIYGTWVGIQYMTAQGDKQKVAAARGRLTWIITGFILLLLSTFIVNAVGYLFKVDLLNLTK